MNPLSIVILHGGAVQDITFLEYLFRVVIYLFAFGGIAGVVYWGLEAINTNYSEVIENPDGRENDL